MLFAFFLILQILLYITGSSTNNMKTFRDNFVSFVNRRTKSNLIFPSTLNNKYRNRMRCSYVYVICIYLLNVLNNYNLYFFVNLTIIFIYFIFFFFVRCFCFNQSLTNPEQVSLRVRGGKLACRLQYPGTRTKQFTNSS